jgi:two-component system chemotaxis response regulator CheY
MPTVLIVDDNADMLELIADTLEMNGFQVLKALNGQIAWEIITSLKSLKGLVVLSDIKMPELDGFELLHRVRNSEQFAQLPLLLMSGDQTDGTVALAARATDFILKPFRVEALRNKLLSFTT